MDRARLNYEMKKRNVTRAQLCQAIGISQAAFYRKCNGTSEFTLREIRGIVDFLHLESPVDIFFTDKVS